GIRLHARPCGWIHEAKQSSAVQMAVCAQEQFDFPRAAIRAGWQRALIGFFSNAAVILWGGSVRLHPIDSDETGHLHVAWGWTRGLIQYRDLFDNHMPLFHLLSAPLVAMIGETPNILYWMRIAVLPFGVIACWAVYQLGKSLFDRRTGAWAAIATA